MARSWAGADSRLAGCASGPTLAGRLGRSMRTPCDVGTRSKDIDIIARECQWVTSQTVVNGGAGILPC